MQPDSIDFQDVLFSTQNLFCKPNCTTLCEDERPVCAVCNLLSMLEKIFLLPCYVFALRHFLFGKYLHDFPYFPLTMLHNLFICAFFVPLWIVLRCQIKRVIVRPELQIPTIPERRSCGLCTVWLNLDDINKLDLLWLQIGIQLKESSP